ncbi:MAG: riboflavin synthase subunit alpha [Caulobacterales bacterium 68-7]|nr:MAG: riboflavin synthase subunit alpha [Caulobacterales bacterium 68-7]
MFSGIVEALGEVRRAEATDGALRLSLATPFADLALGESVAVNGVCLTVVEYDVQGHVDFFVSAETLARSNLSRVIEGDRVNLERAARLSDRLSGHLVQGHVDGQAVLTWAEAADGAWLLTLSLPGQLHRYCVEKGSIALDGVSLTLNGVSAIGEDGRFDIGLTLIPHTWDHTTFHRRPVGAPVNVEVDVLAKYVERLCQPYLKP